MRPVTAVLVFLLAACASPAAVEPSVESSSAGPSDPPSASSSASEDPASLEWVLAASTEGEFLSVQDVAYGAGQYVAIGNDLEAMPGQRLRGRVWLSADGRRWDLLPRDDVFSRAYLTDVVMAGDGSYLVLGHVEDATGSFDEVPLAVWESEDGRSWARVELGLPNDLLGAQIAAGPLGFLLGGVRGSLGRDELWLSADARNWELVLALAPRSGPIFEGINRIGAGAEGFVASGVKGPAAFIVASGNGREWFEATNPPAASAGQPVASIGGNWILAIGGQETGGVAIWFSANGLDWERAAMIGSAGQPTEVVSVLSAADQVFVTLATLGAHPALVPADVWASFDGTAWRQLDLGGEDFITGAAGSGDTVVLVGGRSFFVNLAGKP